MVLAERLKARWLQIVTHIAALLPLALLVWDYAQDQLTADPIREITLRTGRYALILLILSLACTPVHIVFGFKRVLRVRRALGLYAFLYASLHLLTFVGLDYGFDFALVGRAILEKRFVQIGFLTFLILLPLAITSTRGWMKPGSLAGRDAFRLGGEGRQSKAPALRCGADTVARRPHSGHSELCQQPARPAERRRKARGLTQTHSVVSF